MKALLYTQRSDTPHWVGDGFPVRSIFTHHEKPQDTSPFLLMDYAGPVEFPPTTKTRGVESHPHRGFETVTIVYSGEVEHRDSAGGGGKIGPGDIQWMTAASGLVHEEKHGKEFSKQGGLFEMVQLWVNLPAKDKMVRPRYQGIEDKSVPRISLKDDAGYARVIAGHFLEKIGPAKTFTAMNVWDLRLNANRKVDLGMPKGFTTLVFVLSGKVQLGSGEILNAAELGVLDRENEDFSLMALTTDAKILVLGGAPLNEPVIGFGPFVMNTPKEIQQAFDDYNNGLMGEIGFVEGSEQPASCLAEI